MQQNLLTVIWRRLATLSLSLWAIFTTQGLTAQSQPSGTGVLANVGRAAYLFGRQLESSDHQPVGKVDNLVLDLESERILYVIITTPNGTVAVPPQIFGQASGNKIPLKADKQKIESAPRFTAQSGNAAQLGQASFVAQVYQHFGQNAWWQGGGRVDQGSFHNVHKLNELIGMKVENVNNQTIGQVSNVIVDMPTGRIMYALLQPDSNLNLGDNLYALPSDALTLSPDRRHLVSNIDQQKLASAPHFPKNNWPNLTDANFASQVYQYYGKQAWFSGATGVQPTGR